MGVMSQLCVNPEFGILNATGPMLGLNLIVAGFFAVNFIGFVWFIAVNTVGRVGGVNLSARLLLRRVLPV
jgi:hypothetical protein